MKNSKVVRRIVKSIYCIIVPMLVITLTCLLIYLGKLDNITNISIVTGMALLGLGTSIIMATTVKERMLPAIKLDTFPGLTIGVGYDDAGRYEGVIILIACVVIKLYYPYDITEGTNGITL